MLGVYNMSRNTHPMDQIFPWLDRAKMWRQGSASCVSTKGWHCDSVTLCHYCFSHFSPVLINCYPFLAKAVGLRHWSLPVIVCACVYQIACFEALLRQCWKIGGNTVGCVFFTALTSRLAHDAHVHTRFLVQWCVRRGIMESWMMSLTAVNQASLKVTLH